MHTAKPHTNTHTPQHDNTAVIPTNEPSTPPSIQYLLLCRLAHPLFLQCVGVLAHSHLHIHTHIHTHTNDARYSQVTHAPFQGRV